MASIRTLPTSRALATQRRTLAAPSVLKLAVASPRPAVRVHAAGASEGEADFDALLNRVAEKFEKSSNKPAVLGYSAGAVAAFFVAEWLIHLPGLDILLGFPVQLVGLLALPWLVVRYALDSKDVTADVGQAVSTITAKLPGLGK